MATIQATADRFTVHLTTAERICGLLRDLDLPRSAIRSVEVVPNGLRATRGLRAPGTGVPGIAKIGTWRGVGRRAYVVARRRPALRLELTGERYDTLVIDKPEPEQAAASLR